MKKLSAFLILLCISVTTIAQTFVTNGSATKVRDHEFQLTPAESNQTGSIWNSKKIELRNDFIIKAQVFLGYDDEGADGITFALQPLNTSVLGREDGGSYLGYYGITPSIAVEFDTYKTFEFNDPEEDHIAFLENGYMEHFTENNPEKAYPLDSNIEDGKWYDVTFAWKASAHTLTVNFLSHSYTHTADVVNTTFKSSPYVYWGFTGATGAAINDQRVRIINTSFGSITTMTLINADTDEDIMELEDGDTLNLTSLPSINLNIRANGLLTTGSVMFQLSGSQTRRHLENNPPYALVTNYNNDYYGWTPTNGNYILTATPYELKDGKGKKGTPLKIKFHVIYQVVDSLVLVNAETDQDIKTLQNGEVIDLSTLPTTKLNIRAVVHPAKVGSVVFNLNNKLIVKESYVPYAIGGDIKGNYRAWTLPAGKHTLTATPYELENGSGHKGQAYTVKFAVVDPLGLARLSAANQQQSSVINTKIAQVYLSAQPNPFTSSTTINFSVPETGYTNVQLYNSTGKMLEHLYGAVTEAKVVNKLQFRSKELPNGMYMLRLTSGNQVQSFKLLLVR